MAQVDDRERHPLTRIARMQARMRKAMLNNDARQVGAIVLDVLDLLKDAYSAGERQRATAQPEPYAATGQPMPYKPGDGQW